MREGVFSYGMTGHPLGILYEKFGHRVMYDAGGRMDDKVSKVLINGNWRWKAARSDDLVAIQSHLPMVELGENDQATNMEFIQKRALFLCCNLGLHSV